MTTTPVHVDIPALARRLTPRMVEALRAADAGNLRRYKYGGIYIAGGREVTRTAVALARRDLVTSRPAETHSMPIELTATGRAVLDHLTERAS